MCNQTNIQPQKPERESLKESIRGYFTTRVICQLAFFSALSCVLYMYVKFPLPFFPSFLDIQISDVPMLLGGFMMGPLSGSIILTIKILLKLPFSSTAGVGELADLLIGFAYLLPSSFIYKYSKTKKGALKGLIVGIFCTIFVAVIINVVILVPFYIQAMFSGSWDGFLKMFKGLYPNITRQNFYFYYLFLAIIPFNLLRSTISAIVTFLLYKQLHKAFILIFRDK